MVIPGQLARISIKRVLDVRYCGIIVANVAGCQLGDKELLSSLCRALV